MGKKVRCPICGMVVWSSQVNKIHEIEILELKRGVRAKGSGGFKYIRSEDRGLVALVRSKIKALYDKYFDPVFPSISTTPSIRARQPVTLKPNLLIASGVRIVE